MTQTLIIEKMQKIFDGLLLDPVTLTAQLSAKDVDEWDSLLQISIVVAIESEFGIRFNLGEVEGTQNIGEFADLIARKITYK
jgi:acyl carrier protein